MSRPRKPFGTNLPGRLPATMVKVLAAEMADGGRLTRGKRYWADEAVIDIVIGHGSVTGEVQGSRREPYVVTVEAQAGEGVPSKRELWVRCSCPDDTGTGADACKHAVAVLFALSDEIAIEPAMIDRWRSGRGTFTSPTSEASIDSDATPDDVGGNVIAFPTGRVVAADPTDTTAIDSERDEDQIDERRREDEEISMLLRAPTGVMPADLPTPLRWPHVDLRDPIAGPLLEDALDHLEIRWE